MELTVLGRNGPYPEPGGACSGYLVRGGETTVLLDCGAGTVSRLREACPLDRLDAILLSHLHYDHCSDLGVLRYLLEQLAARDGMRQPMPVYAPDAPAHARELLDYPVFDVRPIADGMRVKIGSLAVTFHEMAHPVPTFGMDIVDGDGKRLFYTGDTGWFSGLAGLCRGADALLCDTCFLDADDHGQPLVHLTARQAGVLAKEARVGRLLCTHLWGGENRDKSVQKEVDISDACVVQERGTYVI